MKKKTHQHTGIHSIDYYAYASKLREWNASFKVGFSFLVLLLCIGLDHIGVSLIVTLTMALLTVGMGKLEGHTYLALLKIPLIFMLLGSVAIAIEISRAPISIYSIDMRCFYLCVTKESLFKALSVTLKALGAVSAMYMMTLSTPSHEIIMVLKKIKVPKLIIELMNMIYRFIFILLDVQTKMHQAIESRLGYADLKTSIYSFGNMASSLLVISLKKSNAYYDALESRGYEGELLFLEEEKPCKQIHIYLAILYILSLLVIARLVR